MTTTSKPTTATRACERCGQPVLAQEASFMDMVIYRRYCDPCTDLAWAEENEREAVRELDMRLTSAGGTPRLRTFTWAGASHADAGRKWLADYRAGVRQNLFLDGVVGGGKTGLAWMIVADLVPQPVGAMFVNFRDLLWEIRASFGTNNNEGSLLARRAQTVSVLALDDLGAERPTAWACEELATIIDRRYEKKRPTIVTSNYSPAELAKRLGWEDITVGKRIVSRLTENCQMVRFSGSDRRLAGLGVATA